MNEQITDTIAQEAFDTLPKTVTTDTLVHRIPNPIEVELIGTPEATDWNIWFGVIVVLALIAVIIPLIQKKFKKK